MRLTDLGDHLALVTPIDNRGDSFPPNRVPAPTLEDRSPDSGDGVYVSFSESEDEDIGEYRIFAVAGAPFDSSDGLEPIISVNREEWGPILIENLSGGERIQPDIPIWVAVVSVDSSGNAWTSDLETSMISPVDENSQDPGIHLPEVGEIMAYWDSSGSRIEVIWAASDDPQVLSYSIFSSTMQFSDTRDSILVGSEITSQNASFSSLGPTAISSSDTYWLAVVAHDGEVHRLSVDSVRVYSLSELSPGGAPNNQNLGGESWYDQLVDGDLNMLIALISAIMIIMGAALIIRPRERAAPQPWEMGTMEVEMEEELTREAMGITEEEELVTASLPSSISDAQDEVSKSTEQDLIESIDELAWEPDISVGEILSSKSEEIDLEGLNMLADGLEDDELEDEEIDTSFIDDF